jgi:hypothetical protein
VFVVVYGQAVSIPAEAVSTQCALLLAFVGFTALIRICAPMNLRRLGMIMLLLAGLTGCALGLHRVFALSPMDSGQRLLMVPVCTAALTVFRCTERIVGRLWHPQQETSV